MKNKKIRLQRIPEFIVGDKILTDFNYSYYGVVTEVINNNTLKVTYKIPKVEARKGWCDKCGWPGMLSVNGGTGEVVCQRSGCDHEHGFNETTHEFHIDVDNVIVPEESTQQRVFTNAIVNVFTSAVSKFLFPSTVKENISVVTRETSLLFKFSSVETAVEALDTQEERNNLLFLLIPAFEEIAPKGWTSDVLFEKEEVVEG